jgi:hypothetical protein
VKGVNESQRIEMMSTHRKLVTSPSFLHLLVTWGSRGKCHRRKPEQYARSRLHCTGRASITISIYPRSQMPYLWHCQTVNHRFLVPNLWIYLMATDRHVEGHICKLSD